MPLKILSLIDFFDPGFMGGAGRVFYELNLALEDKGHHLNVICRRAPESSEISTENNINFHTYPEIPGGQFKKLGYYKRSIKKLFLQYIKTETPDFIIVHSSSACLGLAEIFKSMNIPIVYYFHSPWHREYEIIAGKKRSLFKHLMVSTLSAVRKYHENRYINIASSVITLSQSMQNILLETHKDIKKIPLLINPGAADLKKYFPPENQTKKLEIRRKLNIDEHAFIVITSRRLIARTGVDLLINAFGDVIRAFHNQTTQKNLKLILTGTGASENELKQLAVDLKISEHIIFTGHVEERLLPEYYRAGDLFVMPTKELEGFGLSTVEAMATALPVIGTNIGGTPEILSKISDQLIIQECTSAAIAEKIIHFIKEENLQEWSKKSLKCCREYFTWEKHTDRLLDFLQKETI
jgi:glycosyltransferase involved in cell wall biosynthesis